MRVNSDNAHHAPSPYSDMKHGRTALCRCVSELTIIRTPRIDAFRHNQAQTAFQPAACLPHFAPMYLQSRIPRKSGKFIRTAYGDSRL